MWVSSIVSRVGWWCPLEVQTIDLRILGVGCRWGGGVLELAEDQRCVGERIHQDVAKDEGQRMIWD